MGAGALVGSGVAVGSVVGVGVGTEVAVGGGVSVGRGVAVGMVVFSVGWMAIAAGAVAAVASGVIVGTGDGNEDGTKEGVGTAAVGPARLGPVVAEGDRDGGITTAPAPGSNPGSVGPGAPLLAPLGAGTPPAESAVAAAASG